RLRTKRWRFRKSTVPGFSGSGRSEAVASGFPAAAGDHRSPELLLMCIGNLAWYDLDMALIFAQAGAIARHAWRKAGGVSARNS
ncbi:MAG: hypothetical protein KDF61_18230, partial [Rhodocyclaceae bacterium]|nr:hypothetical protein [Rhodocyclaceae bacterium]